MYSKQKLVADLVELSNWLGAPEQDCAILGEGNASARISDDSFLIKASGTELRTLDESGFVEVNLSQALAMLDNESMTDEEVKNALTATKVDQAEERMPSVETTLHAVCLALDGVEFIGHTHPTAINAFACSNDFEKVLSYRLFPDEIVICGLEPLLVPYVDPGVALAREFKQRLSEFVARTGGPPKEIYLQSHGFIALGSSAKEVRSITAMAVKAAKIRLGTLAFGGPRPMSPQQMNRIDTRPDEHYRQNVIKNQ